MDRTCSTCTNVFYIRKEGSPILHKIDCKKLSIMTAKDVELYFEGTSTTCPYWNKSEFDKEKLIQELFASR